MSYDTVISFDYAPNQPNSGAGALYSQIFAPDQTVLSGSTFVAKVTANWTQYAVQCLESPIGFGVYISLFPLTAPPGNYSWKIFLQAGSSQAPSDTFIGKGSDYWDGNTFGGASSVNTLSNIIAEPSAGSVPQIDIRQAISFIFDAAVYGQLANANGSPSVIYNPAGTIARATITNDQFGNRTNIQFNNLP